MVSFKTRVKFMWFFIKTSVIFHKVKAPLNAKLPTPSYLYQIFFKHIIFVSCHHYQPENPSIQRLYGSYILLTSVAFQLSFTTSKHLYGVFQISTEIEIRCVHQEHILPGQRSYRPLPNSRSVKVGPGLLKKTYVIE